MTELNYELVNGGF